MKRMIGLMGMAVLLLTIGGCATPEYSCRTYPIQDDGTRDVLIPISTLTVQNPIKDALRSIGWNFFVTDLNETSITGKTGDFTNLKAFNKSELRYVLLMSQTGESKSGDKWYSITMADRQNGKEVFNIQTGRYSDEDVAKILGFVMIEAFNSPTTSNPELPNDLFKDKNKLEAKKRFPYHGSSTE